MTARSSNTHQVPPSSTSDLDAAIERITSMAESGLPADEFYQSVTRELTAATGGLGSAVWIVEQDSIRLASQRNLPHGREPASRYASTLREAFAETKCRTLRDDTPGEGTLTILCPWHDGKSTGGVLELRRNTNLSNAALAGQIRFAGALADRIASYRRYQRDAAMASRERSWRVVDRFAQAVGSTASLDTAAYTIANDGRLLVECDRLSVIVRRQARWQVIAVSGSDRVQRRSAALSHLERLAALVASQQQVLWSGKDRSEIPPELEDAFDEYHDANSARLAGFLPLAVPVELGADGEAHEEDMFAVLAVEFFSASAAEDVSERCDALRRHSAGPLWRNLVNDQLPLRRLSLLLARATWLRRPWERPKTLLLAAVATATLVAMALIPAPLRVEATGRLEPEVRRHLFSPTDGVVDRLLIEDAGQEVDPGEELIVLRDPDLEYETERVLGELATVRKQLTGLEAERLRAERNSRDDRREEAKRTAEEEALRKQIEGLERQRTVLDRRRDALTLRSPLRGRLLTWQADHLLRSRPVARGQLLLTVAETQGPWGLELEIPDGRIGHVVEAIESGGQPLGVTFILATAPEKRYAGRLETVAPATDIRGPDGPTVSAVVQPLDQRAMREMRPGASVVAKIDCGRRSLLYVLFHDLIHAIRSRILF